MTELERLGRNNKDLTFIMNYIQEKGATLEVLNLPTLRGIEDDNLRRLLNNLILEIYKYQAQAERERIKERQAQGIALAKAQGKYTGRKALFTEDDERLKHAFDLYLSGYSDKDVASMTGINERPSGGIGPNMGYQGNPLPIGCVTPITESVRVLQIFN